MKRWLAIFVLALTPAFAQQAPKPNQVPQLSTADRIALQSCEKIKQDALQQEQTILTEFAASHPGYRVNPQNFIVEPEQPKPALPVKK
jgi:hypothetical protein